MGFFGRVTAPRLKGPVDLVTEADLASEALLVRGLQARFPQDAILAEEGGVSGVAGSPYSWVLDPLDGTTNFFHGLAHFGVSVGLLHHGEPVAGVIFVPPLDTQYVGVVGVGAQCNGRPIHVSDATVLGDAVLATGFPYDRRERAEALVAIVARAIEGARAVRRCGAAVLDLAGVASGTYGGFWEEGLAPWDLAAGVALVRAAGGTVTGFDGAALDLQDGRVIASNGHLHHELSRLVSGQASSPTTGDAEPG